MLDAIEQLDVALITDQTLAELRAGNVLDAAVLEDAIRAIRTLGPEALDSMEVVIGFEAANALRTLAASGQEALQPIDSEALTQALEFFTFRRSLEAYTNSLREDTTVVLSADSELFQYLQGPTASGQDSEADAFMSLFGQMLQYADNPDAMTMEDEPKDDQDSGQ